MSANKYGSNPFLDKLAEGGPPVSNPWGGNSLGGSAKEDALRQKEIELEKKEQTLMYREAKLKEREAKVEVLMERAPNWPRFKPILYHDINKDIPENAKPLVRKLYMAWMLATWTFVLNAIGCFVSMVNRGSNGGANFGISLLIMVIGIPTSWSFWYQQIYNGVKHDSSLSFFFFFLNYSIFLGAMIVLCIGIPGWGGSGFIVATEQLNMSAGAGIFCLIVAGFLAFEVLFGIWQIKNVTFYYRSMGMSLQQAQNEAVRDIASSNAGQQLAKEGVKQAVANKTGAAIV